MRQKYATRLTREDLEKGGITCITEDGRVFRGEKEVNLNINSNGYIMLSIYKLDENGNKIKRPITRRMPGCKRDTDTYIYDLRIIGLHRAMWAWFHGEVPDGYVVDHISNRHTELEDYKLENLQLLTPAENITKEREESKRVIASKRAGATKEHYEIKLETAIAEYEKAKLSHNANEAHNQRSKISYYKARLRFFIR